MNKWDRKNKYDKRESKDSQGYSDNHSAGYKRHNVRPAHRSNTSNAEMTEVTCDNCGKKCEVPFKPTGNKPIYCRSCYKTMHGDSRSEDRFEKSNGRFDRSERFERPGQERFEDKPAHDSRSKDLEQINRKLDKIMKALKIE